MSEVPVRYLRLLFFVSRIFILCSCLVFIQMHCLDAEADLLCLAVEIYNLGFDLLTYGKNV